jgi:hypothetical protein
VQVIDFRCADGAAKTAVITRNYPQGSQSNFQNFKEIESNLIIFERL